MGQIVIAAFRPKEGCEQQLLEVMRDRLPLLRRLGLATDRDNITMRSADGTILDVSEWVDDDAIGKAHESPEVIAQWKLYEQCCDYVSLSSLEENTQLFACFEAIELPD